MANSLSERPFPPAPTQATRRNVLLALPAVAAAQATVPPALANPALANEDQTESATPEWCESEHVKRFYRLARF